MLKLHESEGSEVESLDESQGEEMADSEASDGDEGDLEDEGNAAWADAMLKVLNAKKPKKKKTIVLSKAKKLCDVKLKEPKEELPFDLEVKDEIAEPSEAKKSKKSVESIETKKTERRSARPSVRVKPNVLDKERERTLQKIATKGVVQLFNAVKQQQSEINKRLEKSGKTETKREKIMKNVDKSAFLDVLMGNTKSINVDETVKSKADSAPKDSEEGVWKVLKDDFLMGAKLKDWDKKANDEEEQLSEAESIGSED